jgi:hypothetical protein
MIASAHVAAGAVAGALAMSLRAPVAVRVIVALTVGIVSHLAMDAIPHSDYAFLTLGEIPWVGLGEAFVALGVVLFVARGRFVPGQPLAFMAGIAGSMAPDVKFVVRVLAPKYESQVTRITDRVHGFHATEPLHIWLAFAGEAMLAIGFLYVFWRLIRGAEVPSRGRSTAAAVPPSAS